MVSTLLFKLELWDGLMAPSLGMTMEQTGLSSSERTFICSSSIFFICFMIWINFHHKTGRVGRRPTEPLFFSFMAGWVKEGGQWFQRALVGSQLYSFNCTAMLPIHNLWISSSNHFAFLLLLVAKIREMYPEADGNYMGFKRTWNENGILCLLIFSPLEIWPNKNHKSIWHCRREGVLNIQWIPTVARRTELVDSHSSSEDRIDGFPQQVDGQNQWVPTVGWWPNS